jgi:hypothetical protein
MLNLKFTKKDLLKPSQQKPKRNAIMIVRASLILNTNKTKIEAATSTK